MSRDKRQGQIFSGVHRQRTEAHLVLGGFAILLIVGGALMVFLLGPGPAIPGIAIIAAVGTVLLALYKGLDLLESWLRRQG